MHTLKQTILFRRMVKVTSLGIFHKYTFIRLNSKFVWFYVLHISKTTSHLHMNKNMFLVTLYLIWCIHRFIWNFSLTFKQLFQMHSPKRILALNRISLTEPYLIGLCFSFLIHLYAEVCKEGFTERESNYPSDPLRESYYPSNTTKNLG